MNFQDIEEKDKRIYNQAVTHPLQAYEWGEFRKKTRVSVVRRGTLQNGKIKNPFQLTIHKTPLFPMNIAYFPKGDIPSKDQLLELKLFRGTGVTFVQLEPNVPINEKSKFENLGLRNSFHPLFTKYSFVLDLTLSEDELLKNMHQKTRYNIRLAEKKAVKVEIDNSNASFERYIELTNETTKRQAFYAHDEKYHRLMWETLTIGKDKYDNGLLQAHLLKASYEGKVLVTWVLFTFKDTLYYPYGASSNEHREVMASSLIMWEAIKFGKKLGLNKFDMWGAAPPNPAPSHEWYGFHRFKEGFGPKLMEFVGSFDLVLNPLNYELLKAGDKFRWAYLKTKAR